MVQQTIHVCLHITEALTAFLHAFLQPRQGGNRLTAIFRGNHVLIINERPQPIYVTMHGADRKTLTAINPSITVNGYGAGLNMGWEVRSTCLSQLSQKLCVLCSAMSWRRAAKLYTVCG